MTLPSGTPGDVTTPPRPSAQHTIICVVLVLALVPLFTWFLFVCALSGPEQFFGEFSREAGIVAITMAVLIVVAAVSWGWFFVSYRQASTVATTLGSLLCGAAALLAGALGWSKYASLDDRASTHPGGVSFADDATTLTALVVMSLLPLAASFALRRPRPGLVSAGLASFAALLALLCAGFGVWETIESAGREVVLIGGGCCIAVGLGVLAVVLSGGPSPRTPRSSRPSTDRLDDGSAPGG